MTRLAAAAAAFLAAFFCAPASAAQCAPTQQMMAALQQTGETIVWRGIAGKHLVMLMMHSRTHAWTLVATSPRALTCIVAHGSEAEFRDDVRARTSAPDRERQSNDHR